MALDLALRNDELLGLDVFDRHGAKIGPIAHVYAEEESGRPLFASVKTGLLRLGRSILALKKAEQTPKGIRVPYDRPYVERAPRFDARRDGTLTRAEQVHLNHYYGIVRGDPGLGPGHSTYAGEEHLRGGVTIGTAGYGEARQLARDAAALCRDLRYTQVAGAPRPLRSPLRPEQRVYDDEYNSHENLVRLRLVDESRGRDRMRALATGP